jgi:hypothetical protein
MKKILSTVLLTILGGSIEGVVGLGFDRWSSNNELEKVAERPAARVRPEIESAPAEKPSDSTAVPDDPNWEDEEDLEGFGIFVLSQEYRWKLGTAQVLAPGGKEVDMEEKLKGLLFQYSMKYGDLIAVGTASCEGRRHKEAGRASERSQELIAWLRPVLAEFEKEGHRRLYRLNMGQFRDCKGLPPEQTGEQRRVILVAVRGRRHLDSPVLERTLCATLEEHKPLGFDPAEYSECSLLEAR